MRKKLPLYSYSLFFLLITISVFIFYLFYVNLSMDTILLFLAQKLYLGKWLNKGVFPLFNPHIFLGIPFAFDIGMGNLHPLNLLFLLSYPTSFAAWVACTTLLFLFGFHFFFKVLTKSDKSSFLLTLILFFSGSGFFRLNNPTMFGVIAHYGIFFYSLSKITLNKKNYIFSLLLAILMTLSGHFQFVIFGYVLGFFIAVFHFKIDLKKMLVYFFLLGLFTSWYLLFSIPLILESTRIGTYSIFANIENIHVLQLIELIFPFFLGLMRSVGFILPGPKRIIHISILSTLIFLSLMIRRKIKMRQIIFVAICIILSFGTLLFPFFRVSEFWIIIHIFVLTIIATNKNPLNYHFNKNSKLFIYMTAFIFVEGFIMIYLQSYFIPASLITKKIIIPSQIKAKNNYMQTVVEVSPKVHFASYMHYFPGLGKSELFVSQKNILNVITYFFTLNPTSWSMITDTYAIQGYNTFIPKKLAQYMLPNGQKNITHTSSITNEKGFSITNLDLATVSLYDQRWKKLGVKYFISDRPLDKYLLIAKNNNRYFYENSETESMYNISENNKKYKEIFPNYRDPNQIIFNIKKELIGKRLEIIMNPEGFEAKINGKVINIEKKDFRLVVPLSYAGRLKIYYSPIRHIREVLKKCI